MAIACPYCEHRIHLKSARPGRYKPRCPRCDKTFGLHVPDQEGAGCTVRPLGNETRPNGPPAGPVPEPPAAGPANDRVHAAVAAEPPKGPSGSHLFGLAQTTPDPAKVNLRQPALLPQAVAGLSDAEPMSLEEEAAPRLPRTEVRGYTIERVLGHGGMGTVYLARQLSLDRPVALKIMSKRWASDPVFVARFTREAYAAAQMWHPNIVAIHDIGEVDGSRFFCMEYVRGQSLADLVKRRGKLDPETAVGYVLQAARGLKHAHERGMIHRDIKPDNLLLDEQGVVKVADLGLVKTPAVVAAEAGGRGLGSLPNDMTGVRIALGTPAYMSPEQCRDAAKVDHRADVYSLGCTLYVLVTGRPPFDGTTAVELMTKHAYEPIVPPEEIVARVPRELSAVIQRMMAKDPADRFQNMGEVIRTLEAWLGVRQTGTFHPQEEHISRLEEYTAKFNTAPAVVLRGRLIEGFFAAVVLAAILLTFSGKLAIAFGVIGLAAQSAAAYFVIDGVARKGYLFGRVRQWALGLCWWDRGLAAVGLGLFGLLLAMLGVFWIWVGFGLAGVVLAFAVRLLLDRPAARQRHEPTEACGKQLRRLRLQGHDEEELRQFVAKYAGRDWEEFFEALFGYEAKLTARSALTRGGAAGVREKHAAWREPILAAIDRIETARKQAREQKLLQAVEQARLQAAGLAEAAAKARAEAAAAAMVREAGKIRREEADRAGTGLHTVPPTTTVTALSRGSSNPDFGIEPPKPDRVAKVIGWFVGPYVRAGLAALLVVACGLWVYQNGLLSGGRGGEPTRALGFEGVPTSLTGWVDSLNVGLAGLLLAGSLFYRGNLMAVLVLLGALVAAAGHTFGVRPVEPLQDYHVALILGSALCVVGYRVGVRE